MKPVVVDPEVMGHLVEDCLAYLGRQLLRPAGMAKMLFAEDADAVGCRGEVVHAAVFEHDSLVEPEKVGAALSLGRRRTILNNDVKVVDLVDDPLGEFVEDTVDDTLEGIEVAAIGQFGI